MTAASAADLPADDPVRIQQEQSARVFPPVRFLIISVEPLQAENAPKGGGGYSPEVLAAIGRISEAAQTTTGVDSVLSVSTLHSLNLKDDSLSFVPLIGTSHDENAIQTLQQTIRDTPLFHGFLLSTDENAAAISIFLQHDAPVRSVLRSLEETCSRERGVKASLFGEPVVTDYVQRSVVPDLLLLGSIAVLIIFIFELAATRSLRSAFVLWIMNLLPAVWVLAFFPSAGLSLKMETIYAPIVIVALSTSYGLQLYRNLALRDGRTMEQALGDVTPVLFSAACATILGFTSLFASSLTLLRTMGAILIAGISLALLSSLFVLPLFLNLIPVRRHAVFQGVPRLMKAARRTRVPIVFACLAAALALGIPRIGVDFRVESTIRGRSDLAARAESFRARYGGLDTLELVIDTGTEYGLVDPAAFASLRSLRGKIARDPHVSQVFCIADFVDWLHGSLRGSKTPLAAANEAAIGESLELLSSQDGGLSTDALIDPSYAATCIIVRFDAGHLSAREAQTALRTLTAGMQSAARDAFPAAHVLVTGATVTTDRFLTLLVRSQIIGIGAYLVLAFLFVALFLRSTRWALLSLLLPCAGAIIYLGLIGWLGIPLSGVTVLTIASIMGVGIDGLLCLITFYRARLAVMEPAAALRDALAASGLAIIQSALIIVLSLLCLLASRYSTFAWTGILTGITFLGCTAITLLLIPSIVAKWPGRFH